MRELDFSDFLLFIALLNLAVFAVSLYLVVMPEPTGMISVEGGRYGNVNITVEEHDDSGRWTFIFGNLSSSGVESLAVSGGESYGLELSGSHFSWIIASPNSDVDISELYPADPLALDSYLGMDISDMTRPSNTFNRLINFSLGSSTYEVWSLYTNSVQGDFITALFNDSFGFVFVTLSVPGGIGYDGHDSDFQMLLPVPNPLYTYHFTIYSNSSLDCNTPLGLKADIVGGDTFLSWNPIAGAERYNIYAIDDITDPLNSSRYKFLFSSPSIATVNGNEYTDDVPVAYERYYTVRPSVGVTECQNDEIAGRIDIPLVKSDETAYNFVTIPFILSHSNFTKLIEPILPDFRQAFRYNNSHKLYTDYSLFCFMGICVPFDNIGSVENHVSYWIEVDENTTLPIAGTVKNSTYMRLTPQYNAGGFHVIEGERGTSSVFNDTFPILNSVFEYDNEKKLYTQFSLFCFMGTCVPIGTLDKAEHVRSYWMDIKSEGELTWPE